MSLNQLKFTFQKSNMIIINFIKTNTNGLQLLQSYLKDYSTVYQCAFASLNC